MQIKEFVSPSQITFEVVSDKPPATLVDVKRGQTFLLDGAICMAGDVSAWKAIENMDKMLQDEFKKNLRALCWVTNLQTGRTFTRPVDTPIKWIRVKMTVEGEF